MANHKSIMFHLLFNASDKAGGSRRKDEVKKSGGVHTKRSTKLAATMQAGPFAASDSSSPRSNILICSGVLRGWSYDDGIRNSKVLEAIKNEYGDKASPVVSTTLHGEIRTSSLTLLGLELVAMTPRQHFSRMRHFEADLWEDQAYLSADAFVYSLQIDGEDYFRDRRWESDRFRIAKLLRRPSLVENPRKPLLLLMNTNEEDECGAERLVNLFGLGGHKFQRPVQAVAYSTAKSATNHGILKESLEWLAKTARSSEDEVTTMTVSDTEDEGSVGTSASTSTTISSMPVGGNYVLDYEPTLLGGNPTLQRFEPIKKGTHCPFAHAAKLWGGKVADEFKPRLMVRVDPLHEAASLNAGPLAEFVARCNSGEPLDGFCIEISYPGPEYTVEGLGDRVRIVLTKLAELDPIPGENAMTNMGPIDHPHWRFCFAGEDFFLTTFSPIYGKDSSRYSFGVKRDFLLFQPMTSFGRHGLTEDTPASATNWDHPTTMRDKARVAFQTNGCPYHIPENLPYPVAEHVVKPLRDDGTTCVRWWEPLEKLDIKGRKMHRSKTI